MISRVPQDKKSKSADADIYRDYMEAKEGVRSISDVLLKHGISRSNLYDIIRRVKHGNPGRIKNDTERGRLAALWEHKYKARYLSLPKNREAGTVAELRDIIREMDAEGFPQMQIAALIGKDRSTVIHHLQS